MAKKQLGGSQSAVSFIQVFTVGQIHPLRGQGTFSNHDMAPNRHIQITSDMLLYIINNVLTVQKKDSKSR